MKNKLPLPKKKEAGRKLVVMNSDLEILQSEVSELESMRDRIISLSDHERARFDQMLKDARTENRSLRRELDLRDRVYFYKAGP